MKKTTFSLGIAMLFLMCSFSTVVAQSTTQEPTGIRAKATHAKIQERTDIEKRATVNAQDVQTTYNRNLIRNYGKAIGKEVFSTADFNAMDSAKQAYVSTRPNEFLIVSDPLAAAKNYFTQKKAN